MMYGKHSKSYVSKENMYKQLEETKKLLDISQTNNKQLEKQVRKVEMYLLKNKDIWEDLAKQLAETDYFREAIELQAVEAVDNLYFTRYSL